MKLTGPACTEAISEAEEARRQERAEDSAGGVRVELGVRPLMVCFCFYTREKENEEAECQQD
jgi:hypothetical protein